MRLALPALLAAACASARFDGRAWKNGDEHFVVTPPRGPWRRVAHAGDVAWAAPDHRAVIAANAACRGHRDPPLTVLMNDLLIGTTERRVLLEELATLDGREALHSVVALRLDGVPLVYDMYVIKKDGCVYDLSLVAIPMVYDRVADDFVRFVAGFRTVRGHR